MTHKKTDLSQKLTVVIITYNRARELEKCLDSLFKLPEKFKITVINNNSGDGTKDVVKKFPRVKYIRLRENRYAAARNYGAKTATTPYIAFTDDDVSWKPCSLLKAVETLDKYKKVGAVASKVIVYGKKPDPLNKFFETSPLPRFVPMPGKSLMGFLEGGVVMRRKAFLETGGYGRGFYINGEGRIIAIDMVANGWGITYDPAVICYHYPSPVRDLNKRLMDGAKNAIVTAFLREPAQNILFEISDNIKKSLRHPIMFLGIGGAILKIPESLKYRKTPSQKLKNYFKLLLEQRKQIENPKEVISPNVARVPESI